MKLLFLVALLGSSLASAARITTQQVTKTVTLEKFTTSTSTKKAFTTSTSTIKATTTSTITVPTTIFATVRRTQTITRTTTTELTKTSFTTKFKTTTQTLTHRSTTTLLETVTDFTTITSATTDFSQLCYAPSSSAGPSSSPANSPSLSSSAPGSSATPVILCPGSDGDLFRTDDGKRYRIRCSKEMVRREGSSYVHANSLTQCAEKCSQNAGCQFAELERGTNRCWLSDRVFSVRSNSRYDLIELVQQVGPSSAISSSYSISNILSSTPSPTPTSTTHTSPTSAPSSTCKIPQGATCFSLIAHGSKVEGMPLGGESLWGYPEPGTTPVNTFYLANDGYVRLTDTNSVLTYAPNIDGYVGIFTDQQIPQISDYVPLTGCSISGGSFTCLPGSGRQWTYLDFEHRCTPSNRGGCDNRDFTLMFRPDSPSFATPITLTTNTVTCPCGAPA